MVRVAIILISLIALASCRGDKKDVRLSDDILPTSSNRASLPEDVFGQPPVNKDGTSISPTTGDAATVAAGQPARTDGVTLSPDVNMAVKQFVNMLNVRLDGSKPLRMEGAVISIMNPKINVRTLVTDEAILALTSPDDGAARAAIATQINAYNSKHPEDPPITVDYSLKVQMLPVTSMVGTIKDEANKALDTLLTRIENYQDALVPIALKMNVNFYDKNSTTIPKLFYGTLTIQNQHYVGFKLADKTQTTVGSITMPLTNSTNPADYKMIIQFKDTFLNKEVERIMSLKMNEVVLEK